MKRNWAACRFFGRIFSIIVKKCWKNWVNFGAISENGVKIIKFYPPDDK